jgi:siroheme synthase
VDLGRVAHAVDTLVVLMAAAKLADVCAQLISAGRPPREPASVVQWAGTSEQRLVTGTLRDLPTLASAASIGPPATLVVGEVVGVAREVAAVVPRSSASSAATEDERPLPGA